MLFNTAPFFAFLAAALAAFYLSPQPLRRPILVAASYAFYATWNWHFTPLLIALTALDYTAAQLIEGSPAGVRRKLFLVLSVAANLGFLGFFKYSNFLADNLSWLLGHASSARAFNVVLPLGISFHTFQSLSYVVDVYRGQQKAVRDPVDYALFISFFPQLVAGPIVRAREFFGNLWHWEPPTAEEVSRGIFKMSLGLAKKMAFADTFALVANDYFANAASYAGAAAAWSAVLAFGLQIYFDFSGYSDMAIGMAQLLGFRFPENFRRPYLATSLHDFWQRWHITLSSWLRDYVYIPLGGNRKGALMTDRNLMLTMLVGGFWHGASWNFILWGAYHGALLVLERRLGLARAQSWAPLRWFLTLLAVLIGWVFFRATDLTQSLKTLAALCGPWQGPGLFRASHCLLAALALALALVEERYQASERLLRWPLLPRAFGLSLVFFVIEIFGVTDVTIPFVYFQF